jgi:hypothetical protein
MGLGKKVFVRKNGSQKGGRLYKWSPVPTNKTIKNGDGRKFFCTATPNSQGEDWRVTYVYEIVVINGVQHRIAYVACDYVK